VVKRSNFEELPWYAEKANVRAYLEEINREKKVSSSNCKFVAVNSFVTSL
jgi:hypothetical protein